MGIRFDMMGLFVRDLKKMVTFYHDVNRRFQNIMNRRMT